MYHYGFVRISKGYSDPSRILSNFEGFCELHHFFIRFLHVGFHLCYEGFCELNNFLIRVLLVGFHLLFVGFNCVLHDDELFVRLVFRIVGSF